MESISIGEARSRFSELVSRIASGERFVIRRRERPVAALISVMELERLERASRAAERLALALGQSAELLKQIEAGQVHAAMAAFGLWRDETDLAGLVDEVYENRRLQPRRAAVIP